MERKTKRLSYCIVFAVIALVCVVGIAIISAIGGDKNNPSFVAKADRAYYVQKAESSVEYGADPRTGKPGLYAQLASNDSLTINNVIDLEEMAEKGESFIEFTAVTQEMYKAEYTRIRLEMFDVHDANNYLTIQISASPQMEDSSGTSYFLACASNGQKLTGFEENRNVIHVNNQYGAWSAFSFCGAWGGSDYTGLYYDVTKKAIYAVNNMGARKFIIDFDDPVYFGTYLWDGFTSNEVYCRIRCENYKTDKAKLLVRKYGDFDLSNAELFDDVAPVLNIEYGEYEKESVPNALVNKKYPIFPVTAFDAVDGAVDANVKVYMNYYSDQRLEVNVKNGAFTPKFAAPHYIVYSSVDAHGNKVEEAVQVNVQSSCEPLDITFSNLQTTCVEGDKYVIPQYEAAGGVGKVKIEIFATLNGKEIAIEENGVRPYVDGTLKIKYVLTDYIGQTYEVEHEIEVTKAVKPTFIESPILPKYLIAGNRYTFPKLNAYDYITSNGKAIETTVSVLENGKPVALTENVYVPNEVSQAEIVYKAQVGNATSEYRKILPVFSVSDAQGLDMAKYFLPEKNGVASASSEAVNLTVTEDERFDFINYVTALSFRTQFSLGETLGTFEKFHVLLTDIEDSDKVLKFSYVFIGEEAYFYLNDNVEGKVAVKGNLEAGKRFRLNLNTLENKVYYDIKTSNVLPVTTFMNGESYNGFTNSRAYITYWFEGVSQETTVSINDINGGYLSDEKEDWIKPIMAWAGDVGGQREINTTVTLPKLLANDVLCGDVDAYLTIKSPSGKVVTDARGIAMNNFLYDGTEITFLLSEYGDYMVTATARDDAGNKTTSSILISVADTENPVLNISDSIVTTAKVGDKIRLPKATATDNYTQSLTVFVYVVFPTGEAVAIDTTADGFIASVAGEYTVLYTVDDEAGNFVTEYFKIKVTGGK